jgi:tRNA (mo5U34)-methyltransferase
MSFVLPLQLQSIHDERLETLKKGQWSEVYSEILKKNKTITLAQRLKPWRKGPFELPDFKINAEWDCAQKWSRLEKHLKNPGLCLDIGGGNGYYMQKLIEAGATEVIGFEPGPLNFLQFKFIQNFASKSDESQKFFLLGAEHVSLLEQKFDTILYMGIFYHHRDPLDHLMKIREALKPNGSLFLETIGIAGMGHELFIPTERYAGMPNVWMLPTLNALIRILERLKFTQIEVISKEWGGTAEQRATEWSGDKSYQDVIDPMNSELTIEGHPIPQRFLIRAKRKA